MINRDISNVPSGLQLTVSSDICDIFSNGLLWVFCMYGDQFWLLIQDEIVKVKPALLCSFLLCLGAKAQLGVKPLGSEKSSCWMISKRASVLPPHFTQKYTLPIHFPIAYAKSQKFSSNPSLSIPE